MEARLGDSLQLPCGAVLKNRIAKGAMTEGLADEFSRATLGHCNLYRAWSHGGTGLLITGNVQIDRRYMERPGNVAIEGPQDSEQLARLRAFAAAATENGTHCWVQLGHAGRQCDPMVNSSPVGPSNRGYTAIQTGFKELKTRALTLGEIEGVVKGLADAAVVCEATGFTGVQVHAAHGYLISSFLNPRANRRTDRYGGSLENRARLLLESVAAIRKAVSSGFAVSVKINSSDFQHGGFTVEECAAVAQMLDESGVDLIEISGGNYENGAFNATSAFVSDSDGGDLQRVQREGRKNESTRKREAYFLSFVPTIRANVRKAKLMVTGGMRSRTVIDGALAHGGVDVIGIGRPLCGAPNASNDVLEGRVDAFPDFENRLQLPLPLRPLLLTRLGPKVEFVAQQFWMYHQERRMGKGLAPDLAYGVFAALLSVGAEDKAQAAALRGLDCVGAVLNAPPSQARRAATVVGLLMLLAATTLGVWRSQL